MLVRGHVKWFDTTKGYGFVVADDGAGDILLHGNVLRVFGFTSVAEGAEIMLQVQVTERGRQAVEVVDIVPVPHPAGEVPVPPPEGVAAGPLSPARVKWFDRVKGFGFLTPESGPDLFVHFRAIEGSGFRSLKEGQKVTFEAVQGQKGMQADKVQVLG